MNGDLWYACEQPERPTDPYVIWHYREPEKTCRGCQFKAMLVLRQYPDDPHVDVLVGAVGEWEAW